jgi:hypothetical protein
MGKCSQPNPNTFVPAGSTASGQPSAAPKDSLDKFMDVLKTKYNYDAGTYENRPHLCNKVTGCFLSQIKLEHY